MPIYEECKRVATGSHDDLIQWLTSIGPDSMKELFDCDLQPIRNIPASRYWELIRTKPTSFEWGSGALTITGEYWDVHWAHGKIANRIYSAILNVVDSGLLRSLLRIRKQFPENIPIMKLGIDDYISGWTTFGFEENERDAVAETTPNRVFTVSKTDSERRDQSYLMMKYLNPPWYGPVTDDSYVDYFKFLTEDIVIAKGLRGLYANYNSLPPVQAIAHDYQQFWMDRKPFTKTVRLFGVPEPETKFLSTSILRELWNQGDPNRIPDNSLHGKWDMDLIMNSFNEPCYGYLEMSPTGASLALPKGSENIQNGQVTFNKNEGAMVIELDQDCFLQLRKVSEQLDLLVGKVCFRAKDKNEALSPSRKNYYSFLEPWVREHYLSQYFEPFEPFERITTNNNEEKVFCNYYLVRKAQK